MERSGNFRIFRFCDDVTGKVMTSSEKFCRHFVDSMTNYNRAKFHELTITLSEVIEVGDESPPGHFMTKIARSR